MAATTERTKNQDKASIEFEIIVYGATSFVGQILCHYLVEECQEKELRWAMAGRSQSKLLQLKEDLGIGEEVPHFIAESHDEKSLRELCTRTAVVISTVGPYALYGETLVMLCAETGTDYCDLTGEAQWIKRMVDKYQDVAVASGARIVNSCGFDSIPSDLGVHYLQRKYHGINGNYSNTVRMRVKGMKGGASGGTIASGINLYKEAAKDQELQKEMRNFYSLCGDENPMTERQRNIGVEYDKDFSSWVGPFIMAAINTRIVLRSNALLNARYGKDFRYDEAMLTGDSAAGEKRAKRLATGSKLGGVAMAVPPLRWIAQTFFLPKPGQGPSPEQQRTGYFDVRLLGTSSVANSKDKPVMVKVTGDRDPGYGSTAKMLAQSGICLARDVDKVAKTSGFVTPAVALGEALLARLERYGGLTFAVVEQEEQS